MPEFRKVLDAYQGFAFKKDKQTTFGFITKLSIGPQVLAADLTCSLPIHPAGSIKAVAVLTDVLWAAGAADAIYFSGQVSAGNQDSVGKLVNHAPANAAVTFQFAVYEYDPAAKDFFLCFHSDNVDMNGQLEAQSLSVAEQASREVQSPLNYAFTIGIEPRGGQQSLQLALAQGKNLIKSWGV